MANDQINSAGHFFVFDGNKWTLSNDLPPNFSIGTMLAIEDPLLQEPIIQIMKVSFTDPNHILNFIERFSPNEEIKNLRNTIWQMIR